MTNAFYEVHGQLDEVTLAEEQLKLAEKALRQVQVSHKAGLSSNKDVLDSQVAYAQAQVNYANQQIDANISQLQLLYETGLMNKATVTTNQLLDFATLNRKIDETADDEKDKD